MTIELAFRIEGKAEKSLTSIYVDWGYPRKKTSLEENLAKSHLYKPIRDSRRDALRNSVARKVSLRVVPKVSPRVLERVSTRLLAKLLARLFAQESRIGLNALLSARLSPKLVFITQVLKDYGDRYHDWDLSQDRWKPTSWSMVHAQIVKIIQHAIEHKSTIFEAYSQRCTSRNSTKRRNLSAKIKRRLKESLRLTKLCSQVAEIDVQNELTIPELTYLTKFIRRCDNAETFRVLLKFFHLKHFFLAVLFFFQLTTLLRTTFFFNLTDIF